MPSDDILYHYTTQKGFLGILKNREIWASGIQHLNDASEFTYAVDIALRALENMKMDDPIRTQLYAIVSTLQFSWDVFVTSLSAEGDQLGQWRAYCSGGGFSIGFDVAALRKLAGPQGFELQQCTYRSAEHDADIERVVEEAVRVPPSQQATFSLLQNFLSLAPKLKHPSFEAEREWRLFNVLPAPLNGSTDIHYRVGKSFFIPYRKFQLGSSEQLPIREIVIGPTAHPDLSRWTVRNCLFTHGLTPTIANIRNSTVPYRDW
jgi:hypothetical protein